MNKCINASQEMDPECFLPYNNLFSFSADHPLKDAIELAAKKDALAKIYDQVLKECPSAERMKEMADFIEDEDGIPAEDVVFIVMKLAAKKEYANQEGLYADYCTEVEIFLEDER
jgi:hypothetical protein